MYKNVAGQKIAVYAWDNANGVPKTGDAANITAIISKDGAAGVATDDVNPTELSNGVYLFDLTQAETNTNLFILLAVSSSTDIYFSPVIIYTVAPIVPANIKQVNDLTIDGSGTSVDPWSPS